MHLGRIVTTPPVPPSRSKFNREPCAPREAFVGDAANSAAEMNGRRGLMRFKPIGSRFALRVLPSESVNTPFVSVHFPPNGSQEIGSIGKGYPVAAHGKIWIR